MCAFVHGCDQELQIGLSGLFFFRDEKCYLIMLFAVLSAEDLLLLPDAAGMFAAGYSDLIFFFFKLDCKAISETSGKFPSI